MSMLGLHLLQSPPVDEVVRIINAMRAPVVKNVGDPAYLRAIIERVDHPIIGIQRFWWESNIGNPDFFGELQVQSTFSDFSPRYAVERWLQEVNLSALRGMDNIYIESYNEVNLSPEYMAFEGERARFLRQEFGLRSCVLNSGVGWEIDWALARDIGLLDALRQTGGALGVHGYDGLFMGLWHGRENQALDADGKLRHPLLWHLYNRRLSDKGQTQTWLAFRVARYHAQVSALGYGDVKFILTEFGYDNAGDRTYRHYTNGQSARGWKDWRQHWLANGFISRPEEAEAFAAHDLAWSNLQLEKYADFLLGATLFTYGSDPTTPWHLFDIRGGVTEHLIQALQTQDRQKDALQAQGKSSMMESASKNLTSPTPTLIPVNTNPAHLQELAQTVKALAEQVYELQKALRELTDDVAKG